MASFTPSNPPKNLTMADVYSSMNRLGGPAKQCRWAARILPVGQNNVMSGLGYNAMIQDLVYMCEVAELPGRGFDLHEVRYYGPNLILPRNSKYSGNINMTFLCRNESFERQLFDDWLEMINPTTTWDFRYPEEYYCEIQLFQLAEYGNEDSDKATEPKATYQWSLYQAWPMQVNPQPANWVDPDVQRLTVTFCYRYWARPGRDTA